MSAMTVCLPRSGRLPCVGCRWAGRQTGPNDHEPWISPRLGSLAPHLQLPTKRVLLMTKSCMTSYTQKTLTSIDGVWGDLNGNPGGDGRVSAFSCAFCWLFPQAMPGFCKGSPPSLQGSSDRASLGFQLRHCCGSTQSARRPA